MSIEIEGSERITWSYPFIHGDEGQIADTLTISVDRVLMIPDIRLSFDGRSLQWVVEVMEIIEAEDGDIAIWKEAARV